MDSTNQLRIQLIYAGELIDYYNHGEATVGLYFIYFDYFSNRLVEPVDPSAAPRPLQRGDPI